MRRLPAGRSGFSLTELVIAMLLSSFVLIGIIGISSQMVRFEVEGMKKGTVTGWSLVALTAMNKEIEDGTVLAYPTNGTGARDTIMFCKNYSRYTGAALDSTQPVQTIGYCYDSAAPGYFRRWTAAGCPAGVPSPPACNTVTEVIATGVYRDASNNAIFRRADEVGGVQIRYRVGNPNPTPNMPQAQTLAFDFKFAMNKQYSNTVD